jgi:hypothetical protein
MELKKLIYLASPYTHPDSVVRERRFHKVSRCAGWLMLNADIYIFSPISMCHQMWLEVQDMPGAGFEWEFWANFDEVMINKCDEFWIYCAEGWERSVGVTAERKITDKLGIPTRYVTDDGLGGYAISDIAPSGVTSAETPITA